MIRAILAIIVGFAAWTVLWLGGNVMLFAEEGKAVRAGDRLVETGPLLGILGLSIACSLLAGLVAALVAGMARRPALFGLAALLVLTGIGFQVQAWSLMPAWYHVTFLVLLVPGTLLGGALAPRPAGLRAPDG